MPSIKPQQIKSVQREKTEDLFLFPFGGNSREAALSVDLINRAFARTRPRWRLKGFLDDNARTHGQSYGSVKVLGDRSLAKQQSFKGRLCAVPAHPDRFGAREKLIRSLNWPDDRWATLIDPTAVVSPDAVIGKNTVILSHCYIGPGVRIGDHCVILAGTAIHHDSVVEDYATISSRTTVSGHCRIGRSCYVGSGVAIRQQIQVGPGSLIGIGATVVKNVPADVVIVGNPGRVLRKVA